MRDASIIDYAFASILFAIALCMVVGVRIVWLQQIGRATYTKVKGK